VLSAALVHKWLCLAVAGAAGFVAAAVVWTAYPAESTASVVLRCKLRHPQLIERPGGRDTLSKDEVAHEQRNLIALVRNPKVLDSPEVRGVPLVAAKPAGWLAANLRAGFTDDTEFLSLALAGLAPDDQKTVLNAVAKAFQDEVDTAAVERRGVQTIRLERAIVTTEKSILEKLEELGNQAGAPGKEAQDSLRVATKAALTAELVKIQAELRRNVELERLAEQDIVDAPKRPLAPGVVDAAVSRAPVVLAAERRVATAEQAVADRLAKGVRPEADQMLPDLRHKVDEAKAELEAARKAEAKGVEQTLRQLAADRATEELLRVKREIALLTSQKGAIQKELNDPKNRMTRSMLDDPKLELRRREVEQLGEMYKALKDSLERLKFEAGNEASEVTIIHPATTGPPNVRAQAIRAAGAGFGLAALATAAVGVWELARRRVRTPEEVTARLGLRLLGTLPPLDRRSRAVPALSPTGAAPCVDNADGIRAALLRDRPQPSAGRRVILVTSARPVEGKSVLALHLAASLARAGKRALLIDADLRRPSLHTWLQAPQRAGLSEVLTGTAALADVVQRTPHGFDFVSAGFMTADGLAALARVDRHALLGPAVGDWEFVVIDTPPVLAAPDSRVLGGLSDGVILAARVGVSRIDDTLRAARLLGDVGCSVLGAVLNGVPSAHPAYYRVASDDADRLPFALPLESRA
jgi:capsular exopolysaccharide synthesis family protein